QQEHQDQHYTVADGTEKQHDDRRDDVDDTANQQVDQEGGGPWHRTGQRQVQLGTFRRDQSQSLINHAGRPARRISNITSTNSTTVSDTLAIARVRTGGGSSSCVT